ncbi:MAG: DUF2301 domain-containing membrane protein [Leptospirales bacterium]
MGDPNVKEPLTTFDKISVTLYRSGIVFSTLSLVYAVAFFYLGAQATASSIFSGGLPFAVFWLFIICVDVSVSFLHLYSKQVLRIIQGCAAMGTIILLTGFLFFGFSTSSIFYSEGIIGKVGLAGLGFVAAGFAGIGAKEAFCFKLNEGYAYGILSALLVIGHFFGIYSPQIALGFLAVITVLVVVFTIRKLFLPLHYDIGDKSKY